MTEFKGRFGGGDAPPSPTRTPDTLRSRDTVEVVLGIAEGEIKGLKDGEKSFLVGDTPLTNENGEKNFKTFELNFFPGESYPDPVRFNLGGITRSNTVNTSVRSETPIVRTTQGGDINRIEVRLQVQQLFEQNDKGVFEHELKFKLQYKPQSASTWLPFAEDVEIKIEGKTSTPYIKEIGTKVEPIDEPYEVRIIKTSPESDTQFFTDFSWESFQEVVSGPRQYQDTAVVQVYGESSDQFSSIPDFSGIYQGRIVRVPSNYDPVARTYTGMWDGAWKYEYTNNPVWCLYDFIMHDRYGVNAYYTVTADKFDFYEAAKWCDESVPDGKGGTQPRFTFNQLISEARNGREMVRWMAGVFNAIPYDDLNGTVHLRFDHKNEQAVALFTPENVVDGAFEYSYTDVSSRFNDVSVTFIDPNLNWNENRRRVYDQEHMDKFGRIPFDFAAVGCTNEGEAIRRAKYKLYTALTETEQVSFKTNRQGQFVAPYEIILIADPDMETSISGRIKSVTGGTTCELFEPIYLEAGVNYHVKIQCPDGMHVTDISTGGQPSGEYDYIELGDPLPANAPEFPVFSLGADGYYGLPKPYRILSISEGEHADDITITALEVNRAKWDYVDDPTAGDVEIVDETQQELPNPNEIPPSPLNLQVKHNVEADPSGTTQSIDLSWEHPKYPYRAYYICEVSENDGPFTQFTQTGETSASMLVRHANYTFRVFLVNTLGIRSKPATLDSSIGRTPTLDTVEVHGLEIEGKGNDTTFDTKSPRFMWRASSVTGSYEIGSEPQGADSGFLDKIFKDYLIDIVDPVTDEIVFTDITKNQSYTFQFDDNAALEGGPYRAFDVYVYMRDTFNRLSAPAQINVENPAPEVPTGVAEREGSHWTLRTDPPPESMTDWAGLIVWQDIEDNFDVSDDKIAYRGSTYETGPIPLVFDSGIYFRYAWYDSFGKTGLNISNTKVLNPNRPVGLYGLKAQPTQNGIELSWDQPEQDPNWDTTEVFVQRIDSQMPEENPSFSYAEQFGPIERVRGTNYKVSFLYLGRSELNERFIVSTDAEKTNQEFVENLYQQYLERPGDSAGITFYKNQLDGGTSRPQVLRNFLEGATSELDDRQYVNRLYELFLNRQGDAAGLDFWEKKLKAARYDRIVVFQLFITAATAAEPLSNDQFVDKLFQIYLGRNADQAGLDFWSEVANERGDTFRVWIRPLNQGGASGPASNGLDVQPGLISGQDLNTEVADGAYVNVPEDPTGLTVTAIKDGIRISWDEKEKPPRTMEVFYNTSNSVPASPQATSDGTSIELHDLNQNANYWFWIRASNGPDKKSNVVGPSTFSVTPDDITELNYEEVTNGVQIYWNEPSDPKWSHTEVYAVRIDPVLASGNPQLEDATAKPPIATVAGTEYTRVFKRWLRSEASDAFVNNTDDYSVTDDAFVVQLYASWLQRTVVASDPGPQFYINKLTGGDTRIEVERDFLEGATGELDDGEFVDRCYELFLNRSSDPAGRQHYVGQLGKRGMNRVKLKNQFLDAATHEISDADFVINQFLAYVDRTPTATEKNNWIERIVKSGGDFRVWVRPITGDGMEGNFTGPLDVIYGKLFVEDFEPVLADELGYSTPGDPSNLTATGITGQGVMLNWSLPDPAPKYVEIYHSTSSTRPAEPTSILAAANSFTIRNLAADTSYNFWIRPLNNRGKAGSYIGPVSATALGDGAITTFFQNTQPTAEKVGDLWFDTDDENKLYRWDGSSWQPAADSRISQAVSDAATAQATADSKVVTFYQSTAPTAQAIGDLWVETDNNNKLRRWNGSSWVGFTGKLSNLDKVGRYDLDSVDFDNVTVYGTLTGRNIRTSAGSTRIELDASDNSIYGYESGSTSFKIDFNSSFSPYLWVNVATTAASAYLKNTGSGPALTLYGDLDILSGSMDASDLSGTLDADTLNGKSEGSLVVSYAANANAVDGYSSGAFVKSGNPIYINKSSSGELIDVRNGGSYGGSHGLRAMNDGSYNTSGLVGPARSGDAFYAETGGYGTFTGTHDALILKTAVQPQPGDVVIDVQTVAKKSVMDAITEVAQSTQAQDKRVSGVLYLITPLTETDPETGNVRWREHPNCLVDHYDPETGKYHMIPEALQIAQDYYFAKINGLGEGQINVCGEGGDIQVGDLLESSSVPGKARKQADDIFRSTTIAKAREKVTFAASTDTAMIACSYHQS